MTAIASGADLPGGAACSLAVPTLPSQDEIAGELARVLASPAFCHAPRLCRLLKFLVEKMEITGASRLNEYAVGISVFDRQAAVYNTGDDPIVRVQVGRLRARLATFYAADGRSSLVRISIPLGSYRPRVERCAVATGDAALAVPPIACLSNAAAVAAFTQGLYEELCVRLLQLPACRLFFPDSYEQARSGVSHLLQGSVRGDGSRLRTTFRLQFMGGGGVLWAGQCDHDADLSIARQEQLALLCSEAVTSHLLRPYHTAM